VHQQLGRKAAEEAAQVGHVAQQHARRVVVAGGIHRLRQVDDHRAVRHAQQDVELRQVAVDHAGAQHAHHFREQRRMVLRASSGAELHVVQARRGIAVLVRHQFHQQHAVVEVMGRGTRTPAAASRYSASTSALCQAASWCLPAEASCPWPWRAPGGCS
jgi:hypothetical protein